MYKCVYTFTNFSHPVEGTLLIYCSDQTGVACTGVINRAWPLHRLRHSLYWGHQQVTPKCQDWSDIEMPQLPQVTRERSIGMLNTGVSVRAVAAGCNAHFSTISRLRRRSNYLVQQLIDHMPTDHVWSHELRIGTSGFSTCAIVYDQRHRQLKKRLVWITDESLDRPY